jgi:hypothetical protein
LILLVTLAGVACLGFGSAFVFAGPNAGAGQIVVRHVAVQHAAGRSAAATLPVCASPPATYSTIQDAVDHAHDNDTITVCAGTYTEQVVIPATLSGLTLSAASKDAVIKDTPDHPSQSKAIVEVAGAHDITITGFTIEGPCVYHGQGCIGYGVEVDNGGSATVDSNDIKDIRDDPLTGNQNGWAIGAIGGSVTATSNTIEGYQKAGIKMTGDGTVDTITGNTIVGAGDIGTIGQNGITISSGASATVSGNNVSNNGFTGTSNSVAGIIDNGSTGAVTIENNTLTHNENNVWVYGVGSDAKVIVRGNTAHRGQIGIIVEDSHGVQVVGNTTEGQANFGLYAAEDPTYHENTSGNTFDGNNASGVSGFGNYDCRDESHGDRTAGTANTWTNNTGVTVAPAGICSPTPPPAVTSTTTVTETTTITVTVPATTVTAPAQTITHAATVTLPAVTVTTPGQTTVVTVPPGQTTTTVTLPAQTVTRPTQTTTVVATVTDPAHGVFLPPHVVKKIVKLHNLIKTVLKELNRACSKALPPFGPGKG